jgi:8-oxo-dGTP pyrophosphatase MutT (NUDIX family)
MINDRPTMTGRGEVRHASRVLLIDAQQRVLLLQYKAGDGGEPFWITPGGGLEEGESHEDAARRELREEVGLSDTELGPWVWDRVHTFPWACRLLEQHERFYFCRIDQCDVCATEHTEDEKTFLLGHRWWSLDELERASEVRFAPRAIATLLRQLLQDGPPAEPVKLGV